MTDTRLAAHLESNPEQMGVLFAAVAQSPEERTAMAGGCGATHGP